jgi:hypothetical protein
MELLLAALHSIAAGKVITKEQYLSDEALP